MSDGKHKQISKFQCMPLDVSAKCRHSEEEIMAAETVATPATTVIGVTAQQKTSVHISFSMLTCAIAVSLVCSKKEN